jgi:hypothetical protein
MDPNRRTIRGKSAAIGGNNCVMLQDSWAKTGHFSPQVSVKEEVGINTRHRGIHLQFQQGLIEHYYGGSTSDAETLAILLTTF